MPELQLNQRAALLCEQIEEDPERLHAAVDQHETGATLIDLGIAAAGGLEAGVALAAVCMAGLGNIDVCPGDPAIWNGPAVAVATDHPVAACMASQYAGWKLAHDKFFSMGSGPMRAAAGKEAIFERIGFREQAEQVVGVLETRQFPPAEVIHAIATDCGVEPPGVTLLLAPTASLAGSVQIVARSVETTLHKLFELGFDLNRVASGCGIAPLPPVAKNDLAGIGRTNDAILYGAEVTLWVRGDDASLEAIGPQVPSCSSRDYGEPFAVVFKKYNHNFYDVDPLLFSPAAVTFVNLDTGRSHRFGQTSPEVIRRSFLS
jgi:methenyltetrahydromethanopterin cyclohydrolase